MKNSGPFKQNIVENRENLQRNIIKFVSFNKDTHGEGVFGFQVLRPILDDWIDYLRRSF